MFVLAMLLALLLTLLLAVGVRFYCHRVAGSGYITKDPLDNNRVCAGFRQCGSAKGVAGMANWDVPLELRCAESDDLASWCVRASHYPTGI